MSSAQKIIQAAAGNAAGEGLYVEDVFSTYLHDGNGSTQTITNGIDLDGEGGLVWVKSRSNASEHHLFDTERGTGKYLFSDTTAGEGTASDTLTAYNSNGMSFGSNNGVNGSSRTYASWTFRKAPKFFDVVTYTGTGSARTVSHNLGSVPGCIIVKSTSNAYEWTVYHRGADSTSPENYRLKLNETSAAATNNAWNNTAPTSTEFSLGSPSAVNLNEGTYVAYLFAHNDDDGGFGEDADQDIIKCGSVTMDGSGNASITLGFEPSWVLLKRTDSASQWAILDTMRGWAFSGTAYLQPNNSNAEGNYGSTDVGEPTATGFEMKSWGANASYIYIAIRRGPMKTPESGTEVFSPEVHNADNSGLLVQSGFTADAVISTRKSSSGNYIGSRLTAGRFMETNATSAESDYSALVGFDQQDGLFWESWWGSSVTDGIDWMFRRAPGFFDVVAYEGNGSTQNVSHNLGAVPELLIVKRRDSAAAWGVYSAATGNSELLQLESSGASQSSAPQWNNTTPTATVFSLGTSSTANASGGDYIAYLFATLPGISKVGSYTGNGTSQTIDCGFSAGARFVLIKRTDSTGDWHVYDSERGIVAGNDPRLELNTTDAEDTGSDDIDPVSSGFSVTSNADVNTNTAEYIFLAIA